MKEFMRNVNNVYRPQINSVITKKPIELPSQQNNRDLFQEHVANIINMLRNASPIEAELIINKNDMFNRKIKKELRRLYYDGNLNDDMNNLIALMISYKQEYKEMNPLTIQPIITNNTSNDLKTQIKIAIENVIIDHYKNGIQELKTSSIELAKQYGIILTLEEIDNLMFNNKFNLKS